MSGAEGARDYRPTTSSGSVLSVGQESVRRTSSAATESPHRDQAVPRAGGRRPCAAGPANLAGAPGLDYMIEHPHGQSALVGHVRARPERIVEAWVTEAEQPRGWGGREDALDGTCARTTRLCPEAETLAKTSATRLRYAFPAARGEEAHARAYARGRAAVRWQCEQLSALPDEQHGPVLDAMFSLKEPKTGADGTMSWTVDVLNPAGRDDFVLGLKEITLPTNDGSAVGVTALLDVAFGRVIRAR